MAEGRQKHHWDMTSLIWVTFANANRDAKEHPRPFCPSLVHPYRTADDYREEQPQHADLADLDRIMRGQQKNG